MNNSWPDLDLYRIHWKMSLTLERAKQCAHDKNRSVVSGRDIYILATHMEKLFSASTLHKCLKAPSETWWKSVKSSKPFKLLTYPLSYSSLQEEPVTEQNTTNIKHSFRKENKESIYSRANGINYSKFTWRWMQRHWDVFNHRVEIFQLRFQLHVQSLNCFTDICPITVVTWS